MIHFFDIGANIGQTFDDYLLQTAAFDGGTIWCFEPSPRHISALREKCEQMATAGHHWRINICPFGLSDRTGWQRVFEKNDPRGDSFFSELYLNQHYIDNRETSVSSIGMVHNIGYFILSNILPPDRLTIKIDAEGSEFPILECLLLFPDIWPTIDCLLVEWHSTEGANDRDNQRGTLVSRIGEAGIKLDGWQF